MQISKFQDQKIQYWKYKLKEKEKQKANSKVKTKRKDKNKSSQKKKSKITYLDSKDFNFTNNVGKLKDLYQTRAVTDRNHDREKKPKKSILKSPISSKKSKAERQNKFSKNTKQLSQLFKKIENLSRLSTQNTRNEQVKPKSKPKQSPSNKKSRSKSQKYKLKDQSPKSAKKYFLKPPDKNKSAKAKQKRSVTQLSNLKDSKHLRNKNNDRIIQYVSELTDRKKAITVQDCIDESASVVMSPSYFNEDHQSQLFLTQDQLEVLRKEKVRVIQDYVRSYSQRLRYKHKKIKFISPRNSRKRYVSPIVPKSHDNQIYQHNLEYVIHEQQQKWLKLRNTLELFRNKVNDEDYLDSIIKEVDSNHRRFSQIKFEEALEKQNCSQVNQIGGIDGIGRIDAVGERKGEEVSQFMLGDQHNQKPLQKQQMQIVEQIKPIQTPQQSQLQYQAEIQGSSPLAYSERETQLLANCEQKQQATIHENQQCLLKDSPSEQREVQEQEQQEHQQDNLEVKFNMISFDIQPPKANTINISEFIRSQKNSSQDEKEDQLLSQKDEPSQYEYDLAESQPLQQSQIIQYFPKQPQPPQSPTTEQNKLNQAFKKRQTTLSASTFLEIYLFNEFMQQLTSAQYHKLCEYYNMNTVDILDDIDADEMIESKQPLRLSNQSDRLIQFTNPFLSSLITRFLDYALLPSRIDLLERLAHPLGVKSSIFLKCLRSCNHPDNEEYLEDQPQEELNLDNIDSEELQSYRQIISNEQFNDFQEYQGLAQYQTESQQYQFFLNRAIYDLINMIFDSLRPYGKKGLPPINFSSNLEATKPSILKIKKQFSKQASKLNSIVLGHINLNKHPQEQQVMRSLTLYRDQIVKDIEYDYANIDENIFQVVYEVMGHVQYNFIQEEVQYLALWLQIKREKEIHPTNHSNRQTQYFYWKQGEQQQQG